MIKITYFAHGTTIDNEKGIATGWQPGRLSELGERQCVRLGEQVRGMGFSAVFCSDLQRAVDSARRVFADTVPTIEDERLRECNYGHMTNGLVTEIEACMLKCVNIAFPGGESYRDVEKKVRTFLSELPSRYSRKHIAVLAHRATQLALEVIINGKTWERAIREDWRLSDPKQWQPGWDYDFGGC